MVSIAIIPLTLEKYQCLSKFLLITFALIHDKVWIRRVRSDQDVGEC